MGRPTKLTKDVQKQICDAIRLGATYKLAAQYGGISYVTFNTWMADGEAADDGDFLEFFNAVKKAESDGALKWLRKIEASANTGNWTAAAWKLERRYPNDYGRQVHEISGKDGKEFVLRVIYGEDGTDNSAA